MRHKQSLKSHPFPSERAVSLGCSGGGGERTNQIQRIGTSVWKGGQVPSTHRGLGHVDANEEDELGDEEVDAQILVDGVAVALQAPEEAEGEDADGEADQRHHDADAGDDGQEQLVAHVDPLWTQRGERVGGAVLERVFGNGGDHSELPSHTWKQEPPKGRWKRQSGLQRLT